MVQISRLTFVEGLDPISDEHVERLFDVRIRRVMPQFWDLPTCSLMRNEHKAYLQLCWSLETSSSYRQRNSSSRRTLFRDIMKSEMVDLHLCLLATRTTSTRIEHVFALGKT